MIHVLPQHLDWNNELPSHWIYKSGGADYVMNREYLDQIVQVLLQSKNQRLPFLVPEDLALAATMWISKGIFPSVQDKDGADRLFCHPESSQHMHNLPRSVSYLHNYHYPPGSLTSGSDCCAPRSITFHHATPKHMRYYHEQLYDATMNSSSCE